MYRRQEIKDDAAAKGWNLLDLFRVARVNRWTGYDFMNGTTNSVKVAAALTRALKREEGFYLVRATTPPPAQPEQVA